MRFRDVDRRGTASLRSVMLVTERRVTARHQFEAALADWNDAVDLLNAAITDFMDDGLQTTGGTWILTMSQVKSETLHVARHRADVAKAALDRIIDDLQMLQGIRQSS